MRMADDAKMAGVVLLRDLQQRLERPCGSRYDDTLRARRLAGTSTTAPAAEPGRPASRTSRRLRRCTYSAGLASCPPSASAA